MEYLTEEGYKKIKEKLNRLKKKKVEVAERLAAAREFGDLAENAEYTSAKEEQGLLEAEIRRLENILRTAIVVKKDSKKKVVQLGLRVIIEIDEEKREYLIVGQEEANPKEGKISINSPLGRALIGKKIGEFGMIETPRGKKRFKIVDIL